MNEIMQHHQWINRIQTLLLLSTLLGIGMLAGWLLLGNQGIWIALVGTVVALILQPATASRLTLKVYQARPIDTSDDPGLLRLARELARRAGVEAAPELYYVPSSIVNAFAVGSRRQPIIVMTDGLLHSLSSRELAGVMAHEMAHITHGDLRVMGLADYLSRLTGFLALMGQIMLLLYLPMLLAGATDSPVLGLMLLIFSPHVAILVQLGLSRVREYNADLAAVEVTGDPEGLASALLKIEQVSGSVKSLLFPGWGHPEPSWLRTHPATEERIRRLRELSVSGERPDQDHASDWPHKPHRRPPRWFPGSGHWR
ncbi:zinc metalloprotease HtpX [Marinobacteraceae bacterium S3BR75-40.1]